VRETLWNTYCRPLAEPSGDWDVRDRFDDAAGLIFSSLVLAPLGDFRHELAPQRSPVSIVLPGIRVVPSVDDGLWFFTHPTVPGEVQLESSSGQLPFVVEGTHSSARDLARTLEEAVALVATRLALRATTKSGA